MASAYMHFLRAIAVCLFLSVLACGMEPPAGEPKDSDPLDFFVVDEEGEPLEGVEAYWWAMGSLRPESQEPIAVSDRRGRIRVDGTAPVAAIGIRAVFLLKDGKACDLVESSFLNRGTKIRIEKESPLSVIVYDEQGKPLEGATVAPSTIDFEHAFWESFITPAMIARLQNKVDATGRVQVHGAKEGRMQQLVVNFPGKGTRGFAIPKNRNKDEPVELIWPNFQGAIRCKVVDANGAPVANVPVTAVNESNSLAINKPTVNYWDSGYTDAEGIYVFEHIPVQDVAVESLLRERRSNHASQKNISVVNGKTIEIELRFEEARPVHFSVIDVSEFEGHEGIEVVFRKTIGEHRFFAQCKTDDEGRGTVELTNGKWDVEIQHLQSIPRGYVLQGPVRARVIEVTSKQAEFNVPPLSIERGDLIEGTIRGFDLASFRSNFVFATVKSKEEEEYSGSFDLNGNFSVTVPKGTDPESIDQFQISGEPRSNRQLLRIVDRENWVLEAK